MSGAMTSIIGIAAFFVFAVGWIFAIIAWFYGAYQLLMNWFRPGRSRKALDGMAAFVAGWLLAMSWRHRLIFRRVAKSNTALILGRLPPHLGHPSLILN